ncbi:hypothetical protein [Brevundimonas sp.]|uniref:hypothetical protein n=1 Tax=Brevundimonas sp. TaxID=1871086 RepID=UPI003BA9FA6B
MGGPLEIIAAIRQEMEAAVDIILTAATDGLGAVSAMRDVDAGAAHRLETGLLQILEACAFQDLTGQRLTSLADTLKGAAAAPPTPTPAPTLAAASLLNGPALSGQGLDQAAADRILSGF